MDAPTVAAVVSSGVFLLSLYQAARQDRLMRQTSELQAEVNRLSVEMDQSLQRLHRVNELTRHIHNLFTSIYGRQYRIQSPEEAADLVGSSVELRALVQVIGDEDLKTRASDFENAVGSMREVALVTFQGDKSEVKITDKEKHKEILLSISRTTEYMHRRVYELLEITSRRRSELQR